MLNLFTRCLEAAYTHTPEGGDYAIQYDRGTLYLLFEWSDGCEDWRNNLDFPIAPYGRMQEKWHCHRGFLRVWRAMRNQVEERVDRAVRNYPVRELVCVGYSHGAALALLATEDMVFLWGKRLTVWGVGFGCPRVLWGYIPSAVKKRLENFRAVRNIPDLVTHMPPAVLGYRHIGLVKIGKRGRYTPVEAHRPEAYQRELAASEITLTEQHSDESMVTARAVRSLAATRK